MKDDSSATVILEIPPETRAELRELNREIQAVQMQKRGASMPGAHHN